MLQLIFIILFAIFVDYNPKSAKPLPNGALDATKDENSKETKNPLNVYPSKWNEYKIYINEISTNLDICIFFQIASYL